MASLLDEIQEALQEYVKDNPQYGFQGVAYGAMPADAHDVKNHIVFNREPTNRSGSSQKDFTKQYAIHIVHEDFIPEDIEFEVISKVTKIKGLRLDSDIEFDYAWKKGSTSTVVEIASFTVAKAVKGCDVLE